jgi:hypothetical protein
MTKVPLSPWTRLTSRSELESDARYFKLLDENGRKHLTAETKKRIDALRMMYGDDA